MNKVITLLIVFLVASAGMVYGQAEDAEKDIKETKSDYEKLFNGKQKKTAEGLITLHKMDGKVYFEFPKDLLGKYMLIGSAVESTSNPGDAAVGEQPDYPVPIYFTENDSSVHMRRAHFSLDAGDETSGINEALGKSSIGPIMESFKIKAISPDSSALVFDATKFFVSGNKAIDPFGPFGGTSSVYVASKKSAYKNGKSVLKDVMAYADNITVSSYLSFDVTIQGLFGGPAKHSSTFLMKRSLILLSEEPARPRINDPRIGIFYTRKTKFSATGNGSEAVYYANRWDLEPKDLEAFKNGELVEPVDPITFYIDDAFPKGWVEHIKAGVKDWNTAFEEIGFKNAIETKMYPENDPAFDPNNLKYTCIKYSPTRKQNAMGPSWVDPRSGEILSASVYIYHGITDLLNEWRFIQTGAADPRVRTTNLPEKILSESIRYVTAHEVGHTLGLMHNMGASSAFPVDSLRSPAFTQKYGTTPSIMDYARFNFVAQPGDYKRGVKLTPPNLGVYDKYAIKWLYTPIYKADTPEEEVPVLNDWISEKIDDPMYRYGKQQVTGNIDPSALSEDLSGDQIKSTKYALENLKYIVQHMNDWVKDEDEDFSFRTQKNFNIINIHFYWYLTHVFANVGGVYQYEQYEGDEMPAYEVVPEDIQRESVLFLWETLADLDWLTNPELEQHINDMNGDAGAFMRRVLVPFFWRQSVKKLGFSQAKAIGDTYTREEFIADSFDFIWGATIAGEKPTRGIRSMQALLVSVLIQNAGVEDAPNTNPFALVSSNYTNKTIDGDKNTMGIDGYLNNFMEYRWDMSLCSVPFTPDYRNRTQRSSIFNLNAGDQVSGFGYFPGVVYRSSNASHIYYGWLLETRDILKQAVGNQEGELKAQYEYLLLKVKKALRVD